MDANLGPLPIVIIVIQIVIADYPSGQATTGFCLAIVKLSSPNKSLSCYGIYYPGNNTFLTNTSLPMTI